MEEIFKIFKMGYFDAIMDAFKSKEYKSYKLVLNKSMKAKIYDIGYIIGYTNLQEYIKNNL